MKGHLCGQCTATIAGFDKKSKSEKLVTLGGKAGRVEGVGGKAGWWRCGGEGGAESGAKQLSLNFFEVMSIKRISASFQ